MIATAPAARRAPDPRRRVFRVHFWLRLVLWVHAAIVDAVRLPYATVPWAVGAVIVAMLAWTLVASWRYIDRARREVWVFGADLVLTLAVVAVSPLLLARWQLGGVGTTLAGYWLVGAPLALAIDLGAVAGGIAGLALALAAFLLRPSAQPEAWGGLLILTLSAAALGWLVEQMNASMRERDDYFAQAAALAERERLNRIVHDGVLQVLAMVERDGSALGPRGQMLAKLAQEQEIKLRALLQARDVDFAGGERVDAAETSLLALLDRRETPSVTVSAMADDLVLPTARAQEIDAVVGEALRNVEKHAGPEAHAWVLVERDDGQLTISVRDNGVGARPQDVLQAARHGRLGVRESVLGRVRDLGGQTELRAAVGRGVEWEFTIPVEPPE